MEYVILPHWQRPVSLESSAEPIDEYEIGEIGGSKNGRRLKDKSRAD